MKIGFIGLGIMGKPMAKNLLKAGYSVVASSSNPLTNEEIKANGGQVVDSLKEIAAVSEVVITMVPNAPEVKDVLFGEEGIVDSLKPGSIVIDMSSIDPLASKDIAATLRERDVQFLDAPVSGGEPKAIEGTVSVMVGGDEVTFEKCLPILQTVGASVVRVGDVGAGNSAKLANQIVVATNIAAVSEALVLADKMGVDQTQVYEAIRGGLAGSTVMDAKAPMMIEGDFEPGFKVDLHLKDIRNVMKTGEALDLDLPLTKFASDILEELDEAGYGKEDHSAIYRYFEKLGKEKK
ncbi:2-hydroxy-3-oxopropionate reductase [Halalkalibacillus sediminis]|uniref:2-hydroxy-3-oxopropionate reductase n=2 Tax=Halalkalibacillus sediminis TaxID=2018042 RepID=A0A2I0QRM6_9BACI|nr:2-hydroxy-3-oxopropionate reductase [Halalkalibacillus sediminis]PKR76986.1 2-hydroxy-3-oxopropionate reductase [Halalkalibacillus sediminis]